MPRPEDVYSEYRDMVQKYLFRLCRNAALAQELTQETFYQALRQWHKFEGKSNIGTWLCGIAKRLYWTTLRKVEPLPLQDTDPSPQPDFVESLIRRDQAMTAHHILHALSEPYREVFTLRTFCDMSHAQIGELFHKSESWARVTYYRARQMLLLAMKEADPHD